MWLVVAIVMLVLYFLVAMVNNNNPTPTKERKKSQEVADELALPTTIENLNELSREVPPIDFETLVRDLRNYPAEFKGKKFFQDNEKKWTVQVMDVSQNDTIVDYLKGRADRDKFAYFRYHTASGEQRYILTYGITGNRQEALGMIKMVDFELPESIDFTAVEMKTYLGVMDNYERSEVIIDASESAPRKINLKATNKELPAQAPPPTKPTKEQTNKTKVVEKEKVADLAVGADEPAKPQQQAPAQAETKPKMPPTAVPTETNDKPKNDSRKEQKPEPKSESKADKPKNEPKAVQEAKVADLEPAPPMNIPGDD